jgi:hypothetical protein
VEALVEESSFLKRLYEEVRGTCQLAGAGGGRCGWKQGSRARVPECAFCQCAG